MIKRKPEIHIFNEKVTGVLVVDVI